MGLFNDAVDSASNIYDSGKNVVFGDNSSTSTSTSTLSPEDQAYIQGQRTRQEDLWPQLKQLADEAGPQSDAAYQAALQSLDLGQNAASVLMAGPQEAEKLYPGITQKLSQVASDLGKLYNKNSEIALKARTSALGQAYAGILPTIDTMTGKTTSAYDQAIKQSQDFSLPPDALNFLNMLRDERVNMLKGDLQNLIGNTVSDLGNRGVLGSSTTEGAMGNVTKSALPAISQINADYANQRLSLPQQLAQTLAGLTSQGNADVLNQLTTKYNLGKNYGESMGNYYDMNTASAQTNADYIAKLLGQQFNQGLALDQTKLNAANSVYSGQPNYAITQSNLSTQNINNKLNPYFQLWSTTNPAATPISTTTTGTGTNPYPGLIQPLAQGVGQGIGQGMVAAVGGG